MKITIELPEEFILLCEQDNIEPEYVLRGFIGDLCGLINWANHPREDNYNSHGSDERQLAREYYERVGYPYWRQMGQ